MTNATRKLLSVLAAVAALNSLLTASVIAAANNVEDVRSVVAAFATAWNRHDLDAFGKLFTPDADFVNVAGLLWTGRQSIQAQHAYIAAMSRGSPPRQASRRWTPMSWPVS
jgi:ketosteroid isomerase-like protein